MMLYALSEAADAAGPRRPSSASGSAASLLLRLRL